MKSTVAAKFKVAIAALIFATFAVLPLRAEGRELLLATTTSTDNTGLLDYLIPMFTKATGIELKWVATGTGKALKLGENCDCDVLMVHAPAAEKAYIDSGFGTNRRQVMFNDFVIIGPGSDPAGIKEQEICSALNKIAEKKATFASRGDNSGTHKKEISLWQECGGEVPERQNWYVQTGQGMLATMNVAAERRGYTMTDRGTYVKFEANSQGNPALKILVVGDKSLLNQYSVIEVNKERCPKVKNQLARQFGDWLVSREGQAAIADFRLLDKQLFTPNALTE